MPDQPDGVLDSPTASESPTDELILQAAIRILARDGYQSLTARKVAEEAGTNLALINYYFGGKQGLLLAIYDALERQRYERQSDMYGSPDEPLSVKWRRAVDYYRKDLDEGFVRVHHELLIQGLANPELAGRVRQRIATWNAMLIDVTEQFLPDLGLNLPPAQLVSAFTAFWYGMEQQHLIGTTEEESPYFEILQLIGDWIEQREHEVKTKE